MRLSSVDYDARRDMNDPGAPPFRIARHCACESPTLDFMTDPTARIHDERRQRQRSLPPLPSLRA